MSVIRWREQLRIAIILNPRRKDRWPLLWPLLPSNKGDKISHHASFVGGGEEDKRRQILPSSNCQELVQGLPKRETQIDFWNAFLTIHIKKLAFDPISTNWTPSSFGILLCFVFTHGHIIWLDNDLVLNGMNLCISVES